MRRLWNAAGFGAVMLGAFAPQATAMPTVTQARPCERLTPSFTQIEFRGTGFTPNARLEASLGGATAGSFADAAGNVLAGISPPPSDSLRRGYSAVLRVAEAEHPERAATTTVRWATWGVSITPSVSFAFRRKRFRFLFTGWRPGSAIYAHYTRYRRKVATRRLGRVRGDCGALAVRMRRIPLRRLRAGQWKVWYTTRRRLVRAGPLFREYLFVLRQDPVFQTGSFDYSKEPPPGAN